MLSRWRKVGMFKFENASFVEMILDQAQFNFNDRNKECDKYLTHL